MPEFPQPYTYIVNHTAWTPLCNWQYSRWITTGLAALAERFRQQLLGEAEELPDEHPGPHRDRQLREAPLTAADRDERRDWPAQHDPQQDQYLPHGATRVSCLRLVHQLARTRRVAGRLAIWHRRLLAALHIVPRREEGVPHTVVAEPEAHRNRPQHHIERRWAAAGVLNWDDTEQGDTRRCGVARIHNTQRQERRKKGVRCAECHCARCRALKHGERQAGGDAGRQGDRGVYAAVGEDSVALRLVKERIPSYTDWCIDNLIWYIPFANDLSQVSVVANGTRLVCTLHEQM